MSSRFVNITKSHAHFFSSPEDLDQLVAKLSKARVVMLGESSHGTHDFYYWRAKISEKLIKDYGFQFVAAEADWPPAFQVNKFVHHTGKANSSRQVLGEFTRWPTWMWGNEEMVDFVQWLRNHNSKLEDSKKAGFYGLDVYSLFESIEVVIKQLTQLDPELAEMARLRYSCFDPYHGDEKAYLASLVQVPEGCRNQVIEVLKALLKRNGEVAKKNPTLFDALQNARIIKNAEDYYRAMIFGSEDSWNVRDRHMMETLIMLLNHYGENSKGIVWAHNTHVGDYRATSMKDEGQINIGGLARVQLGEKNVAIVGKSTYTGSVIASHRWGGPIEQMPVPPGKPGSIEAEMHEVCKEKQKDMFWISMDELNEDEEKELRRTRGHRAIGVVYHPAFERYGNYVPTNLSKRYDHFIFVDRSRAVKPLKVPPDEDKLPVNDTPPE